MPKAYWIARITVREPNAYKAYTVANGAAFRKYGGRFLVRGGRQEIAVGEGRERNVVVEFDDYDAALACFRSPEYRHALDVRGDSADIDLVIVEGYEGEQPS